MSLATKNSQHTVPDPGPILDYWLGPEQIAAQDFGQFVSRWYASSAKTDAEIASRFGATLASAERGELAAWRTERHGAVALIILFDQFSRNLYRGSADAYRNDPAALGIARQLIDGPHYRALPVGWKVIALHPLHHAEDGAAQSQAVALMTDLASACAEDWQPLISSSLAYFREHAATISRFGRFPHRNKALGRSSTQAELAFLEQDSRTYGQ